MLEVFLKVLLRGSSSVRVSAGVWLSKNHMGACCASSSRGPMSVARRRIEPTVCRDVPISGLALCLLLLNNFWAFLPSSNPAGSRLIASSCRPPSNACNAGVSDPALACTSQFTRFYLRSTSTGRPPQLPAKLRVRRPTS
jgi:hypothetical protein